MNGNDPFWRHFSTIVLPDLFKYAIAPEIGSRFFWKVEKIFQNFSKIHISRGDIKNLQSLLICPVYTYLCLPPSQSWYRLRLKSFFSKFLKILSFFIKSTNQLGSGNLTYTPYFHVIFQSSIAVFQPDQIEIGRERVVGNYFFI